MEQYTVNETFSYVWLFMQGFLLSALAAFVWVAESPRVSITNERGVGVVRSKSHRDRRKSHLETELHLAYVLISRGLEIRLRKIPAISRKFIKEAMEMKPAMAQLQIISWMPNATLCKFWETQAQNLLRGFQGWGLLAGWYEKTKGHWLSSGLDWLAQERFLWIPNSIFMKGSMAELLKASPQELASLGPDGSSTTSNLGQFVSLMLVLTTWKAGVCVSVMYVEVGNMCTADKIIMYILLNTKCKTVSMVSDMW